jgi:hypothetical protein
VVEGGLPALLLVAAFLAWWAACARDQWRDGGTLAGRAATIASAAILGHSLVDFPARMTAIAAVLALCLAIMARRTAGQRVRHVTIR